ncbi:MAG: hypothetical protein IJB19_03675 [Clostridia bacterium]|nr:hypothetical protein [Clostridia bacterium]
MCIEVIDMKGFAFQKNGNAWQLTDGSTVLLTVQCREDAADSFEKIEDGAWKWTRKLNAPTDTMRMEFDTASAPKYTMVPAVNYNGNGWGDSEEYVGDSFEGTPWTYEWHRVMIPACTYTEMENAFAVAMMAVQDDTPSCSLYKVESGMERHALVWPEQAGPKMLGRHEWKEAYMGTMEPRDTFEAVIVAFPVERERHQARSLLDFAWRYYGHALPAPMQPEDMWRYSVAFMKSLWTKEKDGFVAFNRGLQWYNSTCFYAKRDQIKYEMGWVGQSASASNTLLYEYLRSGDEDAYEKASMCLDAWPKYTKLDGIEGLVQIKFDGAPIDQTREIPIDACNLGQGAVQYFLAADLMEKCGTPRPEYIDYAMGMVNFVVSRQLESGEFAKSWNKDGSVRQQNGTIGAFLIPAVLEAYKRTNDKKYLDSAVKAFDCYYKELSDNGFTTAGALDTYCIDKESSSPLLEAALALYDVTKDEKYVNCAEDVAWYISTWMMHYTAKYPAETTLSKIGYDTLGITAVSTGHNAVDQYCLRDVRSFLKLYDLTGKKQWQERGTALWCAASQLISDGTLCIRGKVRPAGSQDEAVFQTRWGRPTLPPFNPSEWLVMWPCAFRMETLRSTEDWSVFKRGVDTIDGKI